LRMGARERGRRSACLRDRGRPFIVVIASVFAVARVSWACASRLPLGTGGSKLNWDWPGLRHAEGQAVKSRPLVLVANRLCAPTSEHG
jgi:hypothetical protein